MVELLSNKFEGDYLEKILIAIKIKRLDIVKVLYEKFNKNFSLQEFVYKSIKVGDLEIVK